MFKKGDRVRHKSDNKEAVIIDVLNRVFVEVEHDDQTYYWQQKNLILVFVIHGRYSTLAVNVAHLKRNKMREKDAIEEVIWIERTKFSKTYREIADKLDITIYQVKKVIYERSGKEQKRRRPGRRKSSKN
jgi:hypothetical protein